MSAIQRLKKEFKALKKSPPDGIKAAPLNEENFLLWEISITCPAGSYYAGGEFVATLDFPMDYPMSPPSMKFITPIFHPNVYQQPNTGLVCISTLHPPGRDPLGYENANERWNPTLNIEAIGRSVISILCDPNPLSPANPDAAIMFRDNKDAFIEIAKSCAMKSKIEADRLRLKKNQENEYEATLLADQEKECKTKKEKEVKNVEIGEKRKSEGQDEGHCVKRKQTEDEVVQEEIKSKGEGNVKSKSGDSEIKCTTRPKVSPIDSDKEMLNDTSPGGRGGVQGETASRLGGSGPPTGSGETAPSLDELRSRRLAFLEKLASREKE